MRIVDLGLCVLAGLTGRVAAEPLVPFVIPTDLPTRTSLWSPPADPIAVSAPRLRVIQVPADRVPGPGEAPAASRGALGAPSGAYFSHAGRRVRLWGVNLSFGANLPTPTDAVRVARRLAAAGVNAVRCHHLDTSTWPRGLWDPSRPDQLSSEALARLDAFIAALAAEGIWVDLNLHVGHAHSRDLGLPPARSAYDKIVNLFTPPLVQAQRDFARRLLEHRNPRRQNRRYADDPAIALVEITNENSFFMWDGEETLRDLPPFYETLLRARFNAWLRARYGTRETLAAAWSRGVEPLGDGLLDNPELRQDNATGVPAAWTLEQHGTTRVQLRSVAQTPYRRALRVEPITLDGTDWHLQLGQGGLALEAGRSYVVEIEAVADAPRSITCSVGQAHAPWANLGLSRNLPLTREWQTFRLGFAATEDDGNARVSLVFGGSDVPWVLHRVTLRPGGQVGLTDSEDPSADTVRLYGDLESEARCLDRLVFLAETEKAFFDGMRSFLREDLGCRALITGTIVFGPLGLYAQSDMDFIDAHAYWQHPRFPHTPWDPEDWFIEQRPMTAEPQAATLFRLAAARLDGKPFTVSEYNHPAPLDSQAECVPLLASFAAAQDWDGLWLYTYSHSGDDWDRQHLNSFFDIDTNPAKWGFMPAGSDLFRTGGFGRLEARAHIPLADSDTPLLARLADRQRQQGGDLFAALSTTYPLGRSNLLTAQVAATLGTQTEITPLPTSGPALRWVAEGGRGCYAGEGPGGLVVVGHRGLVGLVTGGQARLDAPDFAALSLTARDGRDLDRSECLLVTACGRCENTDMVFTDDRRSVGTRWGRAPVRIEPVTGALALPAGPWRAVALGPDGRPQGTAEVVGPVSAPRLHLAGHHASLWYLLTRP